MMIDARDAATTLPDPRLEWALFLDVDGTLVEITETPDGARVAPETLALVHRLAALLDGALALVSGRPIRDVDRMFAPHQFAAAGVHGLEHRNQDGMIQLDEASSRLDPARTALRDLVRTTPGVIVEDKGMALTVHYRLAPEVEPVIRRLVTTLGAALGDEFHVQEGKMLLELKPIHRNKGRAVTSFMQEHPFRDRIPVYVGDDVTDEDGFAAVNEMGGSSIRIGSRGPSRARYTISSVERFIAWLTDVATTLDSQRQRP